MFFRFIRIEKQNDAIILTTFLCAILNLIFILVYVRCLGNERPTNEKEKEDKGLLLTRRNDLKLFRTDTIGIDCDKKTSFYK